LSVFIAVVLGVVLLAATAWGQEPSWPTTECSDRVPELTPTCGRRYVEAHPNEPGKLFDVSVVAKWCQENPPWGGSRYRLEKNEITGRYRITEYLEGKWKHLLSSHEWTWSGLDKSTGKIHDNYLDRTLEEMIKILDGYREGEQKYRELQLRHEREENAWKPIR